MSRSCSIMLLLSAALVSCAPPAARVVAPPAARAVAWEEPRGPLALEQAMAAHREEDWARVIQQVEQALPYYNEGAELRRQIELLLLRALARRALGQMAPAREDAQRAQQLLDASLMPLIGARDDVRAGDLPYLLSQARRAGLPVQARSLGGLVASSEQLYATARAEYASFRRWESLGYALRAQAGEALERGELVAACAALKDALELDRSLSAQRALKLDLALARRIAAQVGEPELALRLGRWAEAREEQAAPAGTPLTRWGSAAERRHALDGLRALRRDAARAGRPDPDLIAALLAAQDLSALRGPSWELAAEIGQLLLEQGHHAGARRYLDHAVDSVEALRGQLATPRQREALAANHRALYIAALHASVGVDTDQRAQADYHRALTIAARLKARGLLDHLRAPPAAPRPAPALPDALVAEEVAQRIVSWLEGQRLVAPAARIEAPTSWPRADERVIEYVISQRVGYVWIIHPGGIAMRRVAGWQTLGPLINAWRAQLVRPELEGQELERWRALSKRLHVELIGPIEDLITPASSLVISPDGPLHDLPFEALIKPSRGAEPSYLFESFETRYTPSSAALLRPRATRRGDQALVLGAPRLAPEVPAPLALTPPAAARFSSLPGARAEALRAGAALARVPGLDVQTLIGAQASEAALRRADLEALRYLHISTHGLSDAPSWSAPRLAALDQPALLLAREDTSPEDGIVRLDEIVRWRTSAELVVLSGCTTGRGWEELGAGAYGLAGAFIVAGAQSVVASAWDVSDEATAALMSAFYAQLVRGHSPAAALRQARRQLVTKQRAPFYWAAFRLIS